jgi:ribbon-helix-helix CopG family protein
MKTLTVRLPDALVAAIDAESRARRGSRSDVVRERLALGVPSGADAARPFITDLVGSIDHLPADLSPADHGVPVAWRLSGPDDGDGVRSRGPDDRWRFRVYRRHGFQMISCRMP